jgi:hypothetical protein
MLTLPTESQRREESCGILDLMLLEDSTVTAAPQVSRASTIFVAQNASESAVGANSGAIHSMRGERRPEAVLILL